MGVKSLQTCLMLWPHGLYSQPGPSVHRILQVRILRVGSHSLLQGIFLTEGSKSGHLHGRQILHLLSHLESPLSLLSVMWKTLRYLTLFFWSVFKILVCNLYIWYISIQTSVQEPPEPLGYHNGQPSSSYSTPWYLFPSSQPPHCNFTVGSKSIQHLFTKGTYSQAVHEHKEKEVWRN